MIEYRTLHSIAHVDDINATIKEIYRTCQNGAVLIIIASIRLLASIAQIVTPSKILTSMRCIFSTYCTVPCISLIDYDLLRASVWGPGYSDNSDFQVDFRPLYKD